MRRLPPEVEAFADVYGRHRAQVYAQCLRRLRSAADADDATQVTFLRAWSAIQRGSGPRRTGPWLSTIARNVCADRLGDPHRDVPVDTGELTLVDDSPEPDAGLIAEADSAEVRAALVHLPFAQRSALHLREVDELSYAAVGERLGLPVTAVETLIFRARANLRDELRAVRTPMGCDQARAVAQAVRSGGEVTADQRKRLRNHRSDCARCAWLPVRRARGLAGARAAAVLVVTAAAVTLRRALITPIAEAAATASAPAKTAAVVLTASTAAAGGVAVEHREGIGHRTAQAAVLKRPTQREVRPRVARSTPPVTAAARPAATTPRASEPRSTPVAVATRRSVARRDRSGPERGDGGEPRERRGFADGDREVEHAASTSRPEGGDPTGGSDRGGGGGPPEEEGSPHAQSAAMPQQGEGATTRPDRDADGPGARGTTTG